MNRKLRSIYSKLFAHFGPQHWWPADGPFEVIIGAILTQNTSWKHVEKAISNLKMKNVLSPPALYRISSKRLAMLIKPAGYFNVKAKRLKSFLRFLFVHHNGEIKNIFALKTAQLRNALLGINGIGPETADSILLYAAERPVFVVDAYTKRIFARMSFIREQDSYGEAQAFFMNNLRKDRGLFNEYHALIVRLGKEVCTKNNPRCPACPLEKGCKKLK